MKGFKKYLKEMGIDVNDSKQMSDTLSKSNDLMYSNSDVFDFYSGSKDFNLTDNTKLYEIIKLFKDILDKHIFSRNFYYKINIKNRELILFFEFNNENNNELFIHSLINNVKTRIFIKFKKGLEINQEVRTSDTDIDKTVVIFKIKDLD